MTLRPVQAAYIDIMSQKKEEEDEQKGEQEEEEKQEEEKEQQEKNKKVEEKEQENKEEEGEKTRAPALSGIWKILGDAMRACPRTDWSFLTIPEATTCPCI